MNYRHSYHAGNIADVFKHLVLIEVLAALRRKDTPFCVIDSHAGSGLYELGARGEYQSGIGALWAERERWPALRDYFAAVEAVNGPGALTRYPGSPWLIAAALRPQDRAVLLELHPEEIANLRDNLAGRPGVAVHHVDAWSGLKAFVPPAENRGLVLIDPPYEQADEFARIAQALARALRHWRNGQYLIWYPIKSRAPVDAFHAGLRALGAQAVALEFLTLPLDVPQRLNGSGLVLINPPWRLADGLVTTLSPLAERLAGPAGRPQVGLIDLGPAAKAPVT